MTNQPLSPDQTKRTDARWRAANYLSIGQVYLLGKPLRLRVGVAVDDEDRPCQAELPKNSRIRDLYSRVG